MQLIYNGNARAVIFDGVVCNKGEAVTFPDAIAKQALEQDCWTSPATKVSRPVALINDNVKETVV